MEGFRVFSVLWGCDGRHILYLHTETGIEGFRVEGLLFRSKTRRKWQDVGPDRGSLTARSPKFQTLNRVPVFGRIDRNKGARFKPSLAYTDLTPSRICSQTDRFPVAPNMGSKSRATSKLR